MFYNCILTVLDNIREYFYSDLVEEDNGLTFESVKRYKKYSKN